MPMWGLAAAIGIEQIVLRDREKIMASLEKVTFGSLLVAVFMAIIAISPWSSNKILEHYAGDERSIYDPGLSLFLSDYFERNPDGKIYTDFPILYFLPATKNRIYSPYGAYSPNRNDFDEYARYKDSGGFSYIVASNVTDPSIITDLRNQMANDRYSLVVDYEGYLLIRTRQ